MQRFLKILTVAAFLAAVYLVLGLVARSAAGQWLWWWIEVHTGTVNESGPYYGFWSGFGSDIGEYTLAIGVFANLFHVVALNNCHVGGPWPRGCWLPAWHDVEVNGHKYRVCHKHAGKPILQHSDELGLHHADLP